MDDEFGNKILSKYREIAWRLDEYENLSVKMETFPTGSSKRYSATESLVQLIMIFIRYKFLYLRYSLGVLKHKVYVYK